MLFILRALRILSDPCSSPNIFSKNGASKHGLLSSTDILKTFASKKKVPVIKLKITTNDKFILNESLGMIYFTESTWETTPIYCQLKNKANAKNMARVKIIFKEQGLVMDVDFSIILYIPIFIINRPINIVLNEIVKYDFCERTSQVINVLLARPW